LKTFCVLLNDGLYTIDTVREISGAQSGKLQIGFGIYSLIGGVMTNLFWKIPERRARANVMHN
jgi:hypothetical protein